MRRGVMVAAVSLFAALALAAPAGAISYGIPDGNGHPQVGALLAPVAYSDGTWAACSGTLIARRSSSPPPTATWRSTALP